MATLDVERVIRSPLFTSPCKLIHFVEGLDKFGNPTWTEGESTEVMARHHGRHKDHLEIAGGAPARGHRS